MSAVVVNGAIRRLDGRADRTANITEEDVKQPTKLVRLLVGVLSDVATLKRRFVPRRISYRDQAVDGSGTKKFRFPHGFKGRVDYVTTYWNATAPGGAADLQVHSDTDANTLVLVSYKAGIVTLRIEEAG